MAVYFIIENEDFLHQRIKIGFSKTPGERIRALQTGNSRKLALMGWIVGNDDKAYEEMLHQKYAEKRVLNEWFEINDEVVLEELRNAGPSGYIALQENVGEFLGRDGDGIPEFVPPWEWGDADASEFCPQCGCACGLQYNENYGGERCLKCGIIESSYEQEEL